jgi:hypothetical protein
MNELENLLKQVLREYPELKDYTISVKYSSLPDAYSEYTLWPVRKRVLIEVDYTLRNKGKSLKRAAVASELSHVIKDKKLSRFGPLVFLERWLYDLSQKYRQKDEKQADLVTVSRGFGRDLLSLMYERQRGEDEEGKTHEGLTVEELKEILNKS